MRVTFAEGQARGAEGQEETLEFLVDSGSLYSLLPWEAWQSLGLKSYREDRFVLAGGTAVSRNVSYCYTVLPQREGYSPVVLANRGMTNPCLTL